MKVKLEPPENAFDYPDFLKEEFRKILIECWQMRSKLIVLVKTLKHFKFLLVRSYMVGAQILFCSFIFHKAKMALALLFIFENLRDRYHKLIENVYALANVERELTIVFLAHINHLTKLAKGFSL